MSRKKVQRGFSRAAAFAAALITAGISFAEERVQIVQDLGVS